MESTFYQTGFFALCGLVVSLVWVILFHLSKYFSQRLNSQEEKLEKMIEQNIELLKKDFLILIRKELADATSSVREEFKTEKEHLLRNIKGVGDIMNHNLFDKYQDIENAGNKYLSIIQKGGKPQNQFLKRDNDNN